MDNQLVIAGLAAVQWAAAVLLEVVEAAMGFTPEEYTYKLVFDGTELDGLVMSAGCCTIGEWQDILRGSAGSETRTMADVADNNDKLAKLFLKYLRSWNLEIPKGNPIPMDLSGFEQLSQRHGGMVLTAWQKIMTEVPTNSQSGSNGGGSSPEQSLALASELSDLPNWPGQS